MKNIIITFSILFFSNGLVAQNLFTYNTPSNNSVIDYVIDFKIEKSPSNSISYPTGTNFGYTIRVTDALGLSWGTSKAYVGPNDGPFYSSVYCYYAGEYDIEVKYFVDYQVVEVESEIDFLVLPGNNGQYGCCSMTAPVSSGGEPAGLNFIFDEQTGKVVVSDDAISCGEEVEFDCIQFTPFKGNLKVVSATAQAFESNWSHDASRFPNRGVTNANVIETGQKNIWRVKDSYTYKEELDAHIISSGIADEYKNYDRGTFAYTQFVWKDESANDLDYWIKTSDIRGYSPNGKPTHEVNALGISSGAIFGYNNTQVIGVAQNAENTEISFESFENEYPYVTGRSTTVTIYDNGIQKESDNIESSTVFHTGSKSIRLKNEDNFNISPTLNGGLKNELGKKDLIQVWIKTENPNIPTVSLTVIGKDEGDYSLTTIHTQSFNLVQSCGEWGLFECVVDYSYPTPNSSGLNVIYQMNCTGASSYNTYVDDVRIQPLESEMVTYVYDDQYRIVANFDSQHFALIYQYNEEGKLIRKLKETTEGIVTLSETQYNSKGKARD